MKLLFQKANNLLSSISQYILTLCYFQELPISILRQAAPYFEKSITKNFILLNH